MQPDMAYPKVIATRWLEPLPSLIIEMVQTPYVRLAQQVTPEGRLSNTLLGVLADTHRTLSSTAGVTAQKIPPLCGPVNGFEGDFVAE